MSPLPQQEFPFAPAVKPLTAYADIPLGVSQMIVEIVNKDEGGWVLSHIPGDNDGSWTYGGMTATKFCEFFPKTTSTMVNSADRQGPNSQAVLRQNCVRVYYQDFYLKLISLTGAQVLVTPAMLSAIINCGPGGFSTIRANQAHTESTFTTAWKEYYFTLTRNDASKMQFLRGWINRVWHYLVEAP